MNMAGLRRFKRRLREATSRRSRQAQGLSAAMAKGYCQSGSPEYSPAVIAWHFQGLSRPQGEMQENETGSTYIVGPRNNGTMKSVKALTAIACSVALLASLSVARAETCCEKAKAEGKECAHRCCIKAAKEGKTCEKCNPKKESK